MSRFEVEVDCPLHDSFRVQQVAGMFDVPLAERPAVRFAVDVPDASEDWQIGLIVGPSGSGKTTIARRAFGGRLCESQAWPTDRAVVDGFGDLNIKQITGLLTAVGFGSPPAWVKPYQVLSRGEQFRCDLARALADRLASETSNENGNQDIIAFDEFTSVVDRTVAQMGSSAIAKAIRGGLVPCRFVAVTCHYDVAEWLEPDWVVDMATQSCQRRRLRRPPLEIEVYRCRRRLWSLFVPHHYLSGALSAVARCYVAYWRGRPVAFCATLPLIGKKNYWRITRIVTLPDFQGVGIGMRVAEAVCQMHRDAGCRMNVTASHPALIAHCTRSPLWRTARVLKRGAGDMRRFISNYQSSIGRSVVSFEYRGEAA